MELVIGSKTNPVATDSLITRLCRLSIDGMLYTACPDLASADEVTIDALLVSRRHVTVVFHFPDVSLSDQGFWKQVEEAQDSIYFAVTQKLSDTKTCARAAIWQFDQLLPAIFHRKPHYKNTRTWW